MENEIFILRSERGVRASSPPAGLEAQAVPEQFSHLRALTISTQLNSAAPAFLMEAPGWSLAVHQDFWGCLQSWLQLKSEIFICGLSKKQKKHFFW